MGKGQSYFQLAIIAKIIYLMMRPVRRLLLKGSFKMECE